MVGAWLAPLLLVWGTEHHKHNPSLVLALGKPPAQPGTAQGWAGQSCAVLQIERSRWLHTKLPLSSLPTTAPE